MRNPIFLSTSTVFLMTACSSSIPFEERQGMRESIDHETEQLIEELAEVYPDIHVQIEEADGYATGVLSNIKVPLVGGGSGIGAVYSNTDNSTTYIDLHRYDVGAGLGQSSYKLFSILDTSEDVERFNTGFNDYSWGTEWNLSTNGVNQEKIYYVEDSEPPTYFVFESNVSAVSSARRLSVSKNEELTDTGVGNAKFANHTSVEEELNQKWDKPLPFFAQDVIDQGFSLPLPFGISILYAETRQDMTISGLEAGFNGQGTRPMEFMSFDNNYSHSNTPQLKVDAWVFPFMNVFATVGKVNGMAHVEFTGDGSVGTGIGDSIVDSAICRPGPRPPGQSRPDFCDDWNGFDGWNASVDVDLDGWNYTIGATFAAGWQDYFLAIPVSVSYVDMKNARAEELVFTVSPRVGKQIPLKDTQSIDVYVGVSYLDSSLTIHGEHYEGLDGNYINYKITQENVDKWMGLVGASYNLNREWAIQGEFGQNGSDKRQFVSSLTRRF